jgi:predicted ATPase
MKHKSGSTAGRKPSATALIGRQAEYTRFAECLSRARRGFPMVLLFEGEPGSGKSSLLTAISASSLVVGRNLITARMEAGSTPDLDVVTRAVEMITRPELFKAVGGRRRAGQIVHKLLPKWINVIPVLGGLLSAIVVTSRAIFRRRKAAPARKAVAEDIATLQQLARRRPIAILVDDLQLLCPAAADRLLRLLRTSEVGTRLLVMGTVGTPTPGAARSIARVLEDGLPSDRVVRHRLTPFSPDELDQWLDAKYAADIPREVSNFLLAETGGQPAAILSLLEQLLESGALRRGPSGWEYDGVAAEAQLDTGEAANAYLRGLSEQTAAILRTASVFGDEFDAGTLALLVDIDELDLEDRLSVAVRRGLLVIAGETAHDDGDISTRYRFASTTGRAALQRSLPIANRRELEARAAVLA